MTRGCFFEGYIARCAHTSFFWFEADLLMMILDNSLFRVVDRLIFLSLVRRSAHRVLGLTIKPKASRPKFTAVEENRSRSRPALICSDFFQ